MSAIADPGAHALAMRIKYAARDLPGGLEGLDRAAA
jgi:hypothetical protein